MLLAVFVHTTGVAMAGSLVLVPHAVALVGIRSSNAHRSHADVAESDATQRWMSDQPCWPPD